MEKVKLGLKENWKQFVLLVVINTFVGAMVGMERSVLPQIAEVDFGLVVKTAILSFIVVFGVSKAVANYFAGRLADKIGRRELLILGWLFGIPVPLILMFANHWNWIVIANLFLGINQGLAWSSTVVMKIDLVGEKQRGLAMGFNESVGYLAVGLVAFVTGWIADNFGLRPYPFYLGVAFVFLGLLASVFLLKDTKHHVKKASLNSNVKPLGNVFLETSWVNKNLGSVTLAGLVNNLNDGMVWGLFPILLTSKGFDLEQIGVIVAIYPSVWGLGQLFTGKMSDYYNKKSMLFIGMLAQALSLLAMVWANSFVHFALLSVLLGVGTAIVYPTFLAAMADFTHPTQRAQSIGVFRLWRDLGYAFGAILTGLILDAFGINPSILVIAALTFISAIIIKLRMD